MTGGKPWHKCLYLVCRCKFLKCANLISQQCEGIIQPWNLALQSIRWKNHHYLTPLVCSTIICNSYKLQNSVKCRSLFPPYYIFPVAAAQRRSHYVTLATASVAPPCDNSLGIYTITQCANFNSLDIYTVCKQFMLLHNTCDKGSPYTNSDNCNPLCRNLVQCKLIQCHAIKFNVYLLWVWFRARASIGLLVAMWSMTNIEVGPLLYLILQKW